jgi:hypothetical protein
MIKDENVDLFSHAIVLLKFMEEEYKDKNTQCNLIVGI